ncbi:hypothetical protein Natoc_4146 (plasmid) [Natronococcus occultus SP4]|uniref:Uncharacterized protein n=1 Tax=Natronococcus occultus SP4 TaxID=694430 RepID=L0K6W3_9EURY|nr:hypothetical protein Natoc_4146 [Natronococcus occultus SP4]
MMGSRKTEIPPEDQWLVSFAHESGVRSATIAAIRDRWETRIYPMKAGKNSSVRSGCSSVI